MSHPVHRLSTGAARRRPQTVARWAAAAVAAAALGACSSGTSTSPVTVTVTATPTVVTRTTVPATRTVQASAASTAGDAAKGSLALKNGAYPVFVKKIDTAVPSVTVDVVQILTGPAATKANHGEEVPDDYLIVNSNPRLRTLKVSAAAVVREYVLDDPSTTNTVTFAQFAANASSYNLFTLTVKGGVVTRIEAFYTP